MPKVGVEPTYLIRTAVFKSAAYANSATLANVKKSGRVPLR